MVKILIIIFLIVFPITVAHAIAPVLIPVFASLLEILSGVLFFISAPAIVAAALISFFGLRIRRNTKGRIEVRFNKRVFFLNTGVLFLYMISIALVTFFILKYSFHMEFVVAQKIQPKTIQDLLAGVKAPAMKQMSFVEIFSSAFLVLLFASMFLATLAELFRMIIYRGKIFFNQKIFFQDIVWLCILSLCIQVFTIALISFYFHPFFIQ